MKSIALSLAAALAVVAGSAAAQDPSALAAARRAGIIGERYDGYLGFARAPSTAARKQASAVNIRRKTLYIGLAARRGVTPEYAGIATGCTLLSRLAVGEAYMLPDGVWRWRERGEPPPSPDHCPD